MAMEKNYCPNCDEKVVKSPGQICYECLEWEKKLQKGDLTEDERFFLIAEEAEGHYQTYKNR